MSIAFLTALTISSGAGSASTIMSSGRTSGTPPTLVLTVNSPQLAASKMAIQNASVSELKVKKKFMFHYYCVLSTYRSHFFHLWHVNNQVSLKEVRI